MKTPNIAIFIQHSHYEKFHLMASLIATTISLDAEAFVYLSHEALLDYLENKMDDAPSQFQKPELCRILETGKITAPSKLLKQAKRLGKVHIYGCSESAKLLHIPSEKTKELDGVVGYTTFLQLISDAKWIVF